MVLLVSRRQRQLLSRLEKVSRKSTAQVNRKKTSRKRCSRRLLPAEKEHLRRTRAQNRRALEEAINAAHETMWELAEAMAAKFGKHDATYYFRLCMQRPTKQLNGRRPNKWNAYLHGEVRRRNEELPSGTEKYRCSDLVDELREKWNKMLEGEKKEATKDLIVTLEEKREEKSFGMHSANISAGHDARQTVATLEHECDKLRDRTKTHSFLCVIPAEPDAFFHPTVYGSSPAVLEYIQTVTNEPPERFASRLSSFLTAGVTGLLGNHSERTLAAKHNLTTLVKRLLNEASPSPIPQVKYKNFAKNMTEPYRMIIKNYPPGIKFCAPHSLTSLADVQLVTHAWETGLTHWHRLSDKEYDEWLAKYNDARLEDMREDGSFASGTSTSVASPEPTAALSTDTTTESSPNTPIASSPDPTITTAAATAPAMSERPIPLPVMSALTTSTPVPSSSVPAPSSSMPAPSSSMPAPTSSMPAPTTSLPAVPVPTMSAPGLSTPIPSVPVASVPAPIAAPSTPTSMPTAAPAAVLSFAPTSAVLSPVAHVNAPTSGNKRSRTASSDGPHGKKKAKAAPAPATFINLGCVVDQQGRPVEIETTKRKPRKKETQPRKRASKKTVKQGENAPIPIGSTSSPPAGSTSSTTTGATPSSAMPSS